MIHTLPLPSALRFLARPSKVEDEVGARADVLADLVDDEDEVVLARGLAGDVEHLLDAVVLEADDLGRRGGEAASVLNRFG